MPTDKIVRKMKWDNEGVASTIGTIMALMIFLSILSMFTNQYVPVWMEDNEAEHMNIVFNQFGNMKAAIDNQILFARIAELTSSHYAAIPNYNPITLGSGGVPVLASPTGSQLSLNPNEGECKVSFSYTAGDVSETSRGNIKIYVINRYYIPQTIIYENGALIKSQSEGDFIRAEPEFSVERKGSNVDVTFTQISLYGKNNSLAGIGTEAVHTKVLTVDSQEYENITSSLYINITTEYGSAWHNYFNLTLAKAFNNPSFSYSTNGKTTINTDYYKIEFSSSSGKLYVEIKSPIRRFTLIHAYVDVTIGKES